MTKDKWQLNFDKGGDEQRRSGRVEKIEVDYNFDGKLKAAKASRGVVAGDGGSTILVAATI